MQSENFDKKIKDSLSQRPPGNDSPQWDKMEPLLDKHMPVEKKDRRRIFFILFFFLLLGGGAFFIWKNNSGGKKDISQAKPNTETSTPNNNTVTPIDKEPGADNTKNETTSKDFVKIQSPNLSTPLPGNEIEIDASGKILSKNKTPKEAGTRKTIVKKDKPVKQPADELAKNPGANKTSADEPLNTDPGLVKND